MKAIIDYKGNEIIISSKFAGSTYKWNGRRYHFTIFVIYEGRKMQFTFYDSEYNYSKGITELNYNSLMEAFVCSLSDCGCVIQENNIKDFCYSFGYEIEEGRRIYNTCKRTLYSYEKIGLSSDDLLAIYDSEEMEEYK